MSIINGITLDVPCGQMLAIVGPSGSGKSTLMGLLGGLDTPSKGRIYLDGIDISDMNEFRLTRVRNEKIGFVFQFFHLIPTLTALKNVALPIRFAVHPKYDPNERARELLTLLGMADRTHHLPRQLSGGQQQRVAIARALANDPPILLCDEPTGNLDRKSGQQVIDALKEIRRTLNTTVIVVTHDLTIAEQMDRVVSLEDGQLTEDRLIEHVQER
ncbi:Lipoprotein-releasing system ATP-binding protein LolD [Anaerolineae bacterium]|nr:Lipoprotein-releasing system ATP-binding protein LolD [Anaerolineae bacterium]